MRCKGPPRRHPKYAQIKARALKRQAKAKQKRVHRD